MIHIETVMRETANKNASEKIAEALLKRDGVIGKLEASLATSNYPKRARYLIDIHDQLDASQAKEGEVTSSL